MHGIYGCFDRQNIKRFLGCFFLPLYLPLSLSLCTCELLYSLLTDRLRYNPDAQTSESDTLVMLAMRLPPTHALCLGQSQMIHIATHIQIQVKLSVDLSFSI